MSRLTIDHFDSQLEVTPRPQSGAASAPSGAAAAGLSGDRRVLKEQLREVVTEIIAEEMMKHMRVWGG